MKNRVLISVIWICLSISASGQSESLFSQYMFNGLSINPAFAGSQGELNANFLSRFQSIGLEGAPNTQTFSADGVLPNQKVAVGLILIHDNIGITDQTGVFGQYAYSLSFENSRLSFGLQAGINFLKASYSELDLFQPGDPLFNNSDVRESRVNFGAGVYYYNEKFFGGISIPQLLGEGNSTIEQLNPFLVHGGLVIGISPTIKLEPNILFRMVDWKAVEFNMNANLRIEDVLWAGMSYRPNNSLVMLTEVQLSSQFRLGYSYDFAVNEIRKANNGSHEILLNYRFRLSKQGVVHPRYHIR